MSARRLVAWLSVAASLAGCRAIDGLGGLQFDGASGGGATTGGCADCGDPGCGASCAPAVPAGWTGPLALFEGAVGAAPPCPSAYPMTDFEGGTGPHGDPAVCGACSCDPAAVTCGAVTVESFSFSGCHFTTSQATAAGGACTPISGNNKSVRIHSVEASAGACALHEGTTLVGPLSWSTTALACGLAAPGSGARKPPPPFGAAWCIRRAGDASCPAGYPVKHALLAAQDDRGCSSCICADPSPVTCSATGTVYGDAACQDDIGDIQGSDVCVSAQGAVAAIVTVTSDPAPCAPSGGEPTGAVTTSPTTFCCSP